MTTAKLSPVERTLRAIRGIADTDDERTVLERLEWSGVDNGPACPLCAAHPPLDPANPRSFEAHSPDCLVGTVLAR